LGLLHFATLSTGDTIENPHDYRKAQADLKRKQRKLSRCKRGSHRRDNARKQVAKAHRKICNQRHDFLHKQSRQLVNTYEMIVFEDLSVTNISKAPKPKQDEQGNYVPNGASAKAGLNKSILDAGWGTFVNFTRSKAAYAGACVVLQVDPKNTSQVCSACGEKGEHKDLSVRTPICTRCGIVLNRDHNAAINILRRGSLLQLPLVRAWQGPTVEASSF
jgi:putative transposase